MELQTQAIQATLLGDWERSISLNLQIIEENPQDTEALNRLAFAYAIQGKAKDAKEMYQKVLALDSLNPIALKNLKRLGETNAKKGSPVIYKIDNNMFLEEVGKTKVITLLNTAPSKILRNLQVGQSVSLAIKRLKIFVLDDNKEFLGMLPDNISKRLTKFMDGGNKYEAYLKSIDDHSVSIFVKEVKRAAKYKNQPSFATTDVTTSFSMPKKKAHDLEDDETSEE